MASYQMHNNLDGKTSIKICTICYFENSPLFKNVGISQRWKVWSVTWVLGKRYIVSNHIQKVLKLRFLINVIQIWDKRSLDPAVLHWVVWPGMARIQGRCFPDVILIWESPFCQELLSTKLLNPLVSKASKITFWCCFAGSGCIV